MILSIEGRLSRYASEHALTECEKRHVIGGIIDDVVEILSAPTILSESGWARIKPRYEDYVETAYVMCWTDESHTRAYAYQTMLGESFRRRRRTSELPLFHEYVLTVRQMSMHHATVWCGMELGVYAQYRNGTRIQIRHVEVADRFPNAVRFAVIDGDSLPSDMSIDDYPYASLLALFDVVMECVVCERE